MGGGSCIVGMGLRVGNGREVMMMVMIGMTREDGMMKLLLLIMTRLTMMTVLRTIMVMVLAVLVMMLGEGQSANRFHA